MPEVGFGCLRMVVGPSPRFWGVGRGEAEAE